MHGLPSQVLFSSTLMLSSFKGMEVRRETAMRNIEDSSKQVCLRVCFLCLSLWVMLSLDAMCLHAWMPPGRENVAVPFGHVRRPSDTGTGRECHRCCCIGHMGCKAPAADLLLVMPHSL